MPKLFPPHHQYREAHEPTEAELRAEEATWQLSRKLLARAEKMYLNSTPGDGAIVLVPGIDWDEHGAWISAKLFVPYEE